MNPLLVGVKEGAELLLVSPWTFRNYIASGLIPVVQLPSTKYPGEANRKVLVSVTDLEAFIAKHREVRR